ncbi:hypothetical protein KFK09_022785 [Dendrobium nobile]|uniref:Uncharacterized protein n=1 Tax=Dendrobium nobile TaxID=94219 RepID=A0A8T3AK96_DENNO|nr:hypothetical protein KFK09_022785 [Dendrobium nobile]
MEEDHVLRNKNVKFQNGDLYTSPSAKSKIDSNIPEKNIQNQNQETNVENVTKGEMVAGNDWINCCNTHVVKNNVVSYDLENVCKCESAILGDSVEIPSYPARPDAVPKLNAWKKRENIKVSDLELGNFMSEDGNTVKLHVQNELENSKKFI